ncbi:MAG: sigma-70 family RNA polymerase sigma factor [Ruminococcus sp.]|nr:sigma-70 family RNA polymerase sigma factor [Ruminococcus sp.]
MIDKELCSLLIHRYYNNVFGLCMSLLNDRNAAEDCTQEVFLLFFRKREKLEMSENISKWFHSTARNVVSSYRRKNSGISAELTEEMENIPQEEDSYREQIKEIYDVLGKDDADFLIEYCEADKVKKEEIAKKNGMNMNALYQKIIRLRKKLIDKINN